MRKDEYIDKDGMLDEILRKERLEDEIGDKNMMLIQLWNLYVLHWKTMSIPSKNEKKKLCSNINRKNFLKNIR